MGAEVSGVYGIRVPDEGEQPGEAQGIIHVSALEFQVGYPTGVNQTTAIMQ